VAYIEEVGLVNLLQKGSEKTDGDIFPLKTSDQTNIQSIMKYVESTTFTTTTTTLLRWLDVVGVL
jgi:hypothetical protein